MGVVGGPLVSPWRAVGGHMFGLGAFGCIMVGGA